MRIDAHQHFWRFDPREYSWMTTDMQVLRRDWLPDDPRPLLEQHRMDGCIAVQARASNAETDFLLTLASQHPWIAGVVGWADLRSHHLKTDLARWHDNLAFAGLRHLLQDEADVEAVVRDRAFIAGVKALQRSRLVYDVLIYAHQIEAVTPFCAQLDRHWLVLDHLGKPAVRDRDHAQWARRLRPLAAMPHVACKLSGLVTEALDARGEFQSADLRAYLDTTLDLFGPQRLMFGSDWPVCLLAAPYARVAAIVESWAAQLSPADREAIWGGTAARVYSLRNEPHQTMDR
jgi:L-fuconolactonase